MYVKPLRAQIFCHAICEESFLFNNNQGCQYLRLFCGQGLATRYDDRWVTKQCLTKTIQLALMTSN